MMVARHYRRGLLIFSVSTLGFFISSFSVVLASAFTGPVVSVLDGDTIEVLHNNRAERIRFNGIDCPEKGQAYGHRAKQATSAMVFGKEVTLQTYGKDKYGAPLLHSALFNPASHATAKHQRPPARLDENGIVGVFDALYPFVSLQRDRMKPVHKRRVPQQPFRRDNQRQVALGTHVLNPFRRAQILAGPMSESFLKTIQMLICGHETELSKHL